MKEASNYLKNAIFIILLGIILIPIVVSKSIKRKELPIYGSFVANEKPVFSKASYTNGEFQEKYALYFNDAIPFRSYFLKSHNQLQFTLFREVYLDEAKVGKEDYLFQELYMNELNGKEYIGDKLIRERTKRFKFIQTELEKRGKKLIIVFAPGKASYYSEYIPYQYKKKVGINNYEAYTKSFEENKINYIDFLAHFNALKATTPYPLFGKNGIHWSVYGMHIAMDSLTKKMGMMMGKKLPEKIYEGIELTDTARFVDNDLELDLNLLFPLKGFKMAYPKAVFKQLSDSYKPNTIVVADSYWWVVHNAFIPANQFNTYHFLYYNNSVFNNSGKENVVVTESLINDYVNKTDFVILLVTERNLHMFPFGFAEQLEKILSPNFASKNLAYSKALEDIISEIKNDEAWFISVKEKAKKNNVMLEQQLRDDAEWILKQKKSL
jgi:hypothetical protein